MPIATPDRPLLGGLFIFSPASGEMIGSARRADFHPSPAFESSRFTRHLPEMISMQRQKLLEAMAFFQENTRNCGLVKTFKLLFFLDALHFRETGRSVTGLDYKALPYGPVPTSLYDELKAPGGDLADAFTITSPPASSASDLPPPTQIKVRRKIDPEALTKRELRIAAELAEIFRDVGANEISEVSHKRNGPWDMARRAGNGKWGIPIDFLDAVNLRMGSKGKADVAREELAERAAEHVEVRRLFG